VAWSPDGRRLATASEDNTGKVWDTATSQELLTLRGHPGPVKSVAWSPDGKRLATASSDNAPNDKSEVDFLLTGHTTGNWDSTARVWDAASGQELLTLRGHRGPVGSIAWSPDGKRLATASSDNADLPWW